MANRKKNHYYVLVLTNHGPVFVTDIPERNMAEWDKLEKPKEFGSKSYAEEVAFGLNLNFNTAYPITLPFELSSQPYLYSQGEFEWKWSENEDKEE